VRTECLTEGRFSFCQLQSFMRGMILLANQSWQDRMQETLSDIGHSRYFAQYVRRKRLRVSERSILECGAD
jgi:hypothetical protein